LLGLVGLAMADRVGASALHLAAFKTSLKYLPLKKLLAEPGVDVEVRDAAGVSVLAYAVRKDNLLACELLVAAGANVHAVDDARHSALDAAARYGSMKCLRFLLGVQDLSADWAHADSGNTPLCFAALWGHTDACRVLVESGADVNFRSWGGFKIYDSMFVQPLAIAASKGNTEVVRYLLGVEGIDAHCAMSGTHPLCLASRIGDVGICRMLLDVGAQVNYKRSGYAKTAFFHAADRRHPRLVEYFMSIDGVDVNGGANPYEEGTPLFAGLVSDNTESKEIGLGTLRDNAECTALLLDHPAVLFKKQFVKRCLTNITADKTGILLSGNGNPNLCNMNLTSRQLNRLFEVLGPGVYGLDLRGNAGMADPATLTLLKRVIAHVPDLVSIRSSVNQVELRALVEPNCTAFMRSAAATLYLLRGKFAEGREMPPDTLAQIAAMAHPERFVPRGPRLYERAYAMILALLAMPAPAAPPGVPPGLKDLTRLASV
jgi:ankyrin repeat protein